MKVEKVPDSTYDMIGGLEKQIREIKEVKQHYNYTAYMHTVVLVSCVLLHAHDHN
jgi:hypothetical protein